MEYQVLDDVLNPQNVANMDDDQVLYRLPPHWKCACHALNLVAAVDSTKFDGATLKKASVQTFAKLTAIWNKQNRSTLAAQKIKSTDGTLLPTPGTRDGTRLLMQCQKSKACCLPLNQRPILTSSVMIWT